MSRFRQALVAVMASLVTVSFASVASAKDVRLAKAGKEPNCDVNGKKSHQKDKAACEKKKGKWLESETAATPAAPAPAATPAAPVAPAAPATPAATTPAP